MLKKLLFFLLMLPLMAQTSPDASADEIVRQRLLSGASDLQQPQGLPINPAEIAADDAQAENYFGSAIAVDGDTMIVGAPGDARPGGTESGSAYIFVWDGSEWVQQAKLTAPDATAGDVFGLSVAISGNTAAVGAPLRDLPGHENGGIAFVFVRDAGGNWTHQATMTPTFKVNAVSADFGRSIDLDGDTLVVGSPEHTEFNIFTSEVFNAAGKAWVYHREGTTWSLQGELVRNPPYYNVRLGQGVAISGDTIAVGAPFDISQGGAYIFTRSGGVWTQQARIPAPTISHTSGVRMFGETIDLDGDTVLVGSTRDDGGGDNTGSAYVFERSGSTWTLKERLTRGGNTCCRFLGRQVALGANTVLAATPDNTVFLFNRETAGWTGAFGFSAAPNSIFGSAVDTQDDVLYIGAAGGDLPGLADAGKVYVYEAIPGTDVVAAIEGTPDPVHVGGAVTYTVGVRNAGPDSTTNVGITINLAPDVTYVGTNATQELSCSHTAGVVTCSIASLAHDQIVTFAVYGSINYEGRTLNTTMTVTSDVFDRDTSNNTVLDATAVYSPPIPTNLNPPNNSTFVGEYPVLSWQSASTNAFVIQFGDTLPLTSADVIYNGDGYSFAFPEPVLPGQYYWRVRADNSAWSAAAAFEIVSAADGVPRQHYVETLEITLAWGTLTSADQQYEVEVYNNRELIGAPSRWALVTGNSAAFHLSLNGVYYWRVRAVPDGPWSAVQQLTVNAPD